MNPYVRFVFPCVAAAALSGCGMIRSTSALVQAQQRYESARSAGAEAAAPYEYTLGVEFLRKAQEEAGYSDYQVAEHLAQQAQAFLAEAERHTTATGSHPSSGEAAPEE